MLRGEAQEGTPEQVAEAGTGYLQWTSRHCLSFHEWSEENQSSAVLEPAEVKDTKKGLFQVCQQQNEG